MKPKTVRFEALDALRGVAALIVAIYHLEPQAIPAGFGGHLMVELFLVLSGFVLAHSYLYRPERIGVGDFIYRRWARLWPLHAFTLFFMYGVVLVAFKGQDFFAGQYNNWTTLIQNLTLTHNIGLPPNGEWVWTFNFPSWSISVEFWVNVLFILLVYRSTASWAIALVSGASLVLLWRGYGSLGTYNLNLYEYFNTGLLRGIASFGLGILAYRGYLHWQGLRFSRGWATLGELVALGGTAVLVLSESFGHRVWEIAAPPWFTLVVIWFALEPGWISRASHGLTYLGTISYSVYLTHASMMVLFNDPRITQHLEPHQIVPAAIAGTLLFSHFTYQWVEMPSKNFLMARNPFRRRRKTEPQEPLDPQGSPESWDPSNPAR